MKVNLKVWILKVLKRIGLVLLTSVLLLGCSQKFKDVGATAHNALWGEDDVILDRETLEKMPYASVYARLNDGAQVHMVLAFAEVNPNNGQTRLKWVTADKAMVITEQGRIVKTLGLPKNNLAWMKAEHYPFNKHSVTSWDARYDWQPHYRFGYSAKITRTLIGSEIVETPLQTFKTQYYKERVYFDELDAEIENHYWVDAQGRVIKSRQQLGPDMDQIELLLIKDFG